MTERRFEENPDLSNKIPEAIRTKIIPMLERLKMWSDEDPGKIVHSDTSQTRYKLQKGWFTAVTGGLAVILDYAKRGELDISEEIQADIEACAKEFQSKDFGLKAKTTREDINKVEKVVDEVLVELKKTINNI